VTSKDEDFVIPDGLLPAIDDLRLPWRLGSYLPVRKISHSHCAQAIKLETHNKTTALRVKCKKNWQFKKWIGRNPDEFRTNDNHPNSSRFQPCFIWVSSDCPPISLRFHARDAARDVNIHRFFLLLYSKDINQSLNHFFFPKILEEASTLAFF
jgi:hypothetical protein